MFPRLFRNWRTMGALVLAGAFIGGSYYLAVSAERPPVAQASEEIALLQAIATKDSTGDGLPDWEKVLYGIPTDATTTDYFHLGMTDGEAVARGLIVPKAVAELPAPAYGKAQSSGVDYAAAGLPLPAEGSLTDSFAKSYFTYYLAAKAANGGNDLSQADQKKVAEQALAALTTSVASTPDFRALGDLKLIPGGSDALRAFAVSAEAVMKKNAVKSAKSEAEYLQDIVDNNDKAAVTALNSLSKQYRDTAVGLAALPVPEEIAPIFLRIVNGLMRLSEIDNDYARVGADPLGTVYALEQYPQTEQDIEQAFLDIVRAYVSAGVNLKNGMPGASFVNLIGSLPRKP